MSIKPRLCMFTKFINTDILNFHLLFMHIVYHTYLSCMSLLFIILELKFVNYTIKCVCNVIYLTFRKSYFFHIYVPILK